jgi:RNA polymerase sigma-70 factor (ECF subfamily)
MAERNSGFVDRLNVARAGSPEALGRVLEACRGYLLLIARQELDPELRAKGSASDLVQETFIEAQRDFAQFHGDAEAELLAWLRQMLLNNVRDFTRRHRFADKRDIDREVSLDCAWAAGHSDFLFVSDSASPSEKVILSEKAQIVQDAMKRLSDDHRRVLLLRYREGLSFEEIGPLMERSANAARKLWLRAIEHMEAELERALG